MRMDGKRVSETSDKAELRGPRGVKMGPEGRSLLPGSPLGGRLLLGFEDFTVNLVLFRPELS